MPGKNDSDDHGRPDPKHVPFPIHIDRQMFMVTESSMTGAQLRALPSPPIGSDRVLKRVVPGGQDLTVGDDEIVELHQGMHFVTAPKNVTPGAA